MKIFLEVIKYLIFTGNAVATGWHLGITLKNLPIPNRLWFLHPPSLDFPATFLFFFHSNYRYLLLLLLQILNFTEDGWWGIEFDGERKEREEAVEEGEVPAGGVPLLARLFERQRVHSRSLSIRMAHQAGFVERIHHPQRNSQRLDVSLCISSRFASFFYCSIRQFVATFALSFWGWSF